MKFIVGIDEVGRGPLAGPVTICVVTCDAKVYAKLKRNKQLPPVGKDSKKLSALEREKYAKILKSMVSRTVLGISINHISNKIIDSKGISFSIRKAIGEGIEKLKLKPSECEVRLDGGLKAGVEFTKQKTIIKGDEKERIIAWASILAKVSRDALMCRLSKKYPKYAFEIHKGYGTAKHRKMIQKMGLSPIHRSSFCRRLTF